MKIAIFETEHFEGAFPVIKLFDMPGNKITVYTSRETHKRFVDLFQDSAYRFSWFVLPARGKLRFFYSLYKNLDRQRPDILYLNTISNNHLLYFFVLKLLSLKRVILTVHDINCLFESRFQLNFRKTIIHYGKKWLARQINEFNVVSDTMISYLKTKTKEKKIHNVPGAVFENRHLPAGINEQLRIVVPGSLDKRRRDYEQVFKLAELATEEKIFLQITLLGGYSDQYGENIRGRADKFLSGYCKIISYDTRVIIQDEFDSQMNTAHFVFIPSVINTKICGDIPEEYGITKSSGNIFDVIKHAKPFIVPAGLTISPDLQTSCFKYTHVADLAGFLKTFIDSPGSYDHWQKMAIENSSHYTLEKVRQRNAELFASS
jgi:hypothetical protein